jgi:hypothetical protein
MPDRLVGGFFFFHSRLLFSVLKVVPSECGVAATVNGLDVDSEALRARIFVNCDSPDDVAGRFLHAVAGADWLR